MSQRVVIGLKPNARWASLSQALIAAGAEAVRDPSPEQPNAVVVTLPDERDMDAFVREAKKLAGVAYAEPDSWQSTF